MQKFTVMAPDGVTLADIKAALPGCKVMVAAIPRAKKEKAEIDDRPVLVYRDGEIVREIDAVSAHKAIAKLMAEVNRGKNSDGRHKTDYPHWGGRPDADADAAAYARKFCERLHHIPAQYTCGFTA